MVGTVTTRSVVRGYVRRFPALLARVGIVDREKGERAFDLAVPVMVTGGLRVTIRLADFLMVGIALGDAAIAGLELGFQYYFIGFGLSLALTSGTISVVSRLHGAGEHARANLAVKQSLWLALSIAVPLTVASWLYARPLVALLTDDPTTVAYGADYLRVVMLSLAFRFWGMTAARALAGVGDTRTPMYVRLLSVPTNVVVNALLIFGLGPFPRLGVTGAAVGTAVANVLAATIFLALFVAGRHGIRLPLGGRQFDPPLLTELVRVSLPLAGMRLGRTFGRFPFLFVLGTFGPAALAAYAIGRRVVLFAMMPAWGYATAASTLVGQAIGRGDAAEATDYGWQTARIALATQLLVAGALGLLARPIVLAFGTGSPDLAVAFVRVFAVGVAAFSLSRTMRGALRGAGDTVWPFLGTVTGTYVLRLPVAFLALPAGYAITLGPVTVAPGLGLGLAAVFAAILLDLYLKAAVNTVRFAGGRWRDIGRRSVSAD